MILPKNKIFVSYFKFLLTERFETPFHLDEPILFYLMTLQYIENYFEENRLDWIFISYFVVLENYVLQFVHPGCI